MAARKITDALPFIDILKNYSYSDVMGSTGAEARTGRWNNQQIFARHEFDVGVAMTRALLQALQGVNMDQGARDAMEEILIGQAAFKLAKRHGEYFDSFKFYAQCKGKKE